MDISDAGGVSNRITLRSILVGIAIHLVVVFLTMGLWLLVAIPIWAITTVIVRREVENVRRNGMAFKKSFPFRYFGGAFGDFQHVFHSEQSLEQNIVGAIARRLAERTLVTGLREVTITDVDNDLRRPESRTFMIADGGRTERGTTVTIILRPTSFGRIQSIRWWVTAGGYIDRNKRFNFIIYSPLSFWFWIVPYLSRDYDILPRIRTIYSSSFNEFDVVTQIRALHETVFDALVSELDEHGVDTSDLRVQRMQVMNINVSGGRVNMGNVVQGVANKVVARAGAAQ